MASDDNEAGPDKKRTKLETIQTSTDVRTINRWFPKIDNLEYFPVEVLLKIFTTIDDIGLLNFAKYSYRFNSIAKIVLNERYTNEYLPFDAAKYQSQLYEDFFELFGSEIKAIELEDNNINGEDRWIASILNLMNNLEKLKLHVRHVSLNENLLQEHARSSITHLTLRLIRNNFRFEGFVLFKFHNLKQLELVDTPSISFNLLKEVILNNPGLERLYIGDKTFSRFGAMILESYPFDELMEHIGKHLKQLKELAYVPVCYGSNRWPNIEIKRQPEHIVETFVDSLVHLESLALSSVVVNKFTDIVELLHRFGSQCKNIKHLELHKINGKPEEFLAIKSFQRIEKLLFTIINDHVEYSSIVSLVENLPMLHHLYIGLHTDDIDWLFILVILIKCPSLEKLTISAQYLHLDFEIFTAARFFEDFIACTRKRNVEIVVKNPFEIIGTITKTEVIWRNKRVHWVGYDPSRNLSNIHLLDLAKRSTTNSKAEQQLDSTDPFDLILGYLDLNSLQSLSNTNRKCSQLVDVYVKRHSQQHGTFTITNEFFTQVNNEYKQLNKFTEHANNLKVEIYNDNTFALQNMIEQFHNLDKMFIFTVCHKVPSNLFVPQVRHYVLQQRIPLKYSQLYELSCICPNLQTFELKRRTFESLDITEKRLKFRKLEKFTFTYGRIRHVEVLQDIFKDTDTKLIFKKDTADYTRPNFLLINI